MPKFSEHEAALGRLAMELMAAQMRIEDLVGEVEKLREKLAETEDQRPEGDGTRPD